MTYSSQLPAYLYSYEVSTLCFHPSRFLALAAASHRLSPLVSRCCWLTSFHLIIGVHELVCIALNKSSTSCVRVKFPICLELCPSTHRWSLEDIPTPSVGSELRSRTDGRPGLTSHQDCA